MKGETMQIPKQEYTAEFKELAVKRVKDGLTAGAAAQELGLVEHTLRNWVKAAAAGTRNGAGAKVVTPAQRELSRLRAENVRLTREHDILKNSPHGLPCPLCIETSGGTILQRVDSGRELFGGTNPVKKPGPGGPADPSVAAPSGDPV